MSGLRCTFPLVCVMDCVAACTVNSALMVSQCCVSTVFLHPFITAEHEAGQAASTVFQSLWYDSTGNLTQPYQLWRVLYQLGRIDKSKKCASWHKTDIRSTYSYKQTLQIFTTEIPGRVFRRYPDEDHYFHEICTQPLCHHHDQERR